MSAEPKFYVYLTLDVTHLLTASECLPDLDAVARQTASPQDVIDAMKECGRKTTALVYDWNLLDPDDIEVEVVDATDPRRRASW